MSKTRKKRCWGCNSLQVILWGKRLGRQRYFCKNCGLYFTNKNPSVSSSNRFVWFQKWILGKQSISQLVESSGYSEKTLRNWFDQYLRQYPTWSIQPSEQVNLLIDGTYFRNRVCLVLYRDNNIKFTQLYRLTDNEWYEEILEDLQNLLSLGFHIQSVTCDGHRSILKAVKKADNSIIIQRCLVHIQRMCRIWLTKQPQSQAGIELRKIVNQLHKIENREQWGY